ncbi:low molecular weight protein tyrosine phosphatase family protein [Ponticaulis profundi]|uniref:Low molecular weight protein tyrosine phosphatase family protein n=1 Tax=Ponticaulis profundi TaxID=2665222 RepID=A0ABW1S4Z9_9PROT
MPFTKRDRAWRRAQKQRHDDHHGPRTRGFRYGDPCPKRWYEVYYRRNKLARARQIGLIWPYAEWKALMTDTTTLNLLFICSHNKWRSPTAEKLFADLEGVFTRSAGTARSARHQVSLNDIRWADMIFVMEDKHANRLKADFRQEVAYKPLHVLDIPDDFAFMDVKLIEELKLSVLPLLDRA